MKWEEGVTCGYQRKAPQDPFEAYQMRNNEPQKGEECPGAGGSEEGSKLQTGQCQRSGVHLYENAEG